jgi:hypothetical protein
VKIVIKLGWLTLFALGLLICSAAFLFCGSMNIALLGAAWPFGRIQTASLKKIREFNRKAGAA